MKILAKSALALAIAATTAAPTYAQMKGADITGVSGRFRIAVVCDDDSCAQKDFGGRFRMAAEEDLGNGNTVFGKYEFQVDGSDGTLKAGGNAQRLSYVGIKGGFGSFSLGARWTPFYNVVTSPVDWTKAFGGTWSTSAAGYAGGFRQNNSLFYSVGGFQAMVTVAEDDANEDIDIVELGYTASLGAANVGIAVRDKETDADELIGLNVNGNAGSVRLSASFYSQGDNDSILAQAQAHMGGGTLSFSIGQNSRDNAPEAEMLGLEYERGLGPNSAWFVGIETNDLDDGTDETTRYGAGLHYNFN